MLELKTELYLGPATVVQTEGRRALVQWDDQERWAELALGIPYQPAPDDRVLIASQESRAYVIGVISGTGTTLLSFPGDVHLHSRSGELRLSAAQGVTIGAPNIAIRGQELEVEVQTLREKALLAYRWIKGLFQLKAGRVRTDVEGTHSVLAQEATIRARENVKINGEQIYLG